MKAAQTRQELKDYQARNPSAHGGNLRCFRRGRGARPLSSRTSMHLVLRSTQATGARAFNTPGNRARVNRILVRFAAKHGLKIRHPIGNAGNHLHLHIQMNHRRSYYRFIRAVTSAIATSIGGVPAAGKKFWDYRPFSRIVETIRQLRRLEDYIYVNDLEGKGISRQAARWIIGKERAAPA